MLFYGLLIFVILQRLGELIIAKRNEKKMLARGAAEYDREGYKYIVLMHTMFFISLITEYNLTSAELNRFSFIFLAVFVLAQVGRYWVIVSLGEYWNTRIIVLKNTPLIKKGPYKYFKHPNYIVVAVELAVIPLIFSCYITAIVFTLLNLLVLRRRIRMEERALGM